MLTQKGSGHEEKTKEDNNKEKNVSVQRQKKFYGTTNSILLSKRPQKFQQFSYTFSLNWSFSEP